MAVPPPSRYLRAARQIGHHWHSGGSSPGGSVVAVSHTLACLFALAPPPSVVLTLVATSRLRLRAPAFISHRWKSPRGSRAGWLMPVTLPLQLHHIRHARGAEMADVDALGAADSHPLDERVVHVAEERVPRLRLADHLK